jgi:hypothetical protein
VTDFRMSMTTQEIDAPQLRATQLIASPGSLPTITVPMSGSSLPDVDGTWRHLSEPAEFFGVRMPGLDDLVAAITAFVTTTSKGASPVLITATVTIAETDDAPHILVTGSAVTPMRGEPVRVDGDLPMPAQPRATDPWWRRMAARTTSRAEADRRERWLNGRGYADGMSDGQPVLGALVFETSGEIVGVENSEPTSILDQLTQCGVIAVIDRVTECPAGADRAWWLSPRYRTHPVAELDGRRWPVGPNAVPTFARWS